MKKHNVRRLLVLVLVVALCLLCGAAAQPNPKEIHIYSADDFVQLSKSCKLDTYSQGKTVYLDSDPSYFLRAAISLRSWFSFDSSEAISSSLIPPFAYMSKGCFFNFRLNPKLV